MGDSNAANHFAYENKRAVIPAKLFRYTAISEYAIDNLVNEQHCLNNPRSFNDPFDCWYSKDAVAEQMQLLKAEADFIIPFFKQLGIDVSAEDFTGDDWIERLSHKLPAHMGSTFVMELQKKMQPANTFAHTTMNTWLDGYMRIVCLTQNPPTNLLMWSHYADCHKGICLEYDFRECDDVTYAMLLPVIYQTNIKRVERNGNNENSYWESKILQAVLCKSHEWNYENEWRVIKCLDFPSDKKYFHKTPFIKHIYIGALANKNELLAKCLEYAFSANIPVSQMQRCDTGFSLDAKPYKG